MTVNVSGLPIAPTAVAITRLTPDVALRTHDPTDASPFDPVTTVEFAMLPPPTTVNVTFAPATGRFPAVVSTSSTVGAAETPRPMIPVTGGVTCGNIAAGSTQLKVLKESVMPPT